MLGFAWALVGLYGAEEWEGQGLVEYALILLLVALAVLVLLVLTGTSINTTYSTITTSLVNAAN